jgi:hypothetical protein
LFCFYDEKKRKITLKNTASSSLVVWAHQSLIRVTYRSRKKKKKKEEVEEKNGPLSHNTTLFLFSCFVSFFVFLICVCVCVSISFDNNRAASGPLMVRWMGVYSATLYSYQQGLGYQHQVQQRN